MKFLNHLNINEHELRSAKLYRVTSASYTPAVSSSGNVILDTSAGIPKWWDGSFWRDFSFGTNTTTWNIQSDNGSNIEVNQGDTLDLTGGDVITTTTSGTATAPIVTIDHNAVSRSNTTATKSFPFAGGADSLDIITSITTSAEGHITAVETTTMTNPTAGYSISSVNSTTAPTGEAMIALGVNSNGNFTQVLDTVRMRDGTYIDATVINAGTIDFDLSAVDAATTGASQRFLTKNNTWAVPQFTAASSDTLYNLNLVAVSGNSTRLILDASSGDDDYVNFSGTTNEIEITTPSTGDAGEVKIGLPDDVVITNNLTVGNDVTITGNLDVNGTLTTLDTTNTAITDNIILLNRGQSGNFGGTAGIEIERGGSLPHTQILWNDATNKWTASIGDTSLSMANIIQNVFTTATGNSGTATANSITTALAIQGTNGISTSASGQTITIDGSGVGNQNLYATFIGDSGTTTASTTTDTLDIEGGNGITTTASNDKVSVAFDSSSSGLNIFKTVRPRNTNNAGTVTNGTSAVADSVTDTIDMIAQDESMSVSGGDDFIKFKSAVKTVAVDIDVSSLSELNQAHINHGFGTKDLVVQLWQKTGGGKNENVMAKIETINSSGAASVNDITITFSYVGLPADISDGDADVRCVIMACNLQTAAGATVTYS